MKERTCLNCGLPLKGRQQKYCLDPHCAFIYWQEHVAPLLWFNARAVALRRTGGCCEKCGVGPNELPRSMFLSGIEVHHIIHLELGEPRWKSEKNRQENLKVLCRECHELAHHPHKPISHSAQLAFEGLVDTPQDAE